MLSTPATDSPPLLAVDHLDVTFATPDGTVHAVQDVGFSLDAGESLGIVGESGAGKSQVFLAALGLLATNGSVAGSVRFSGEELVVHKRLAVEAARAAAIAMLDRVGIPDARRRIDLYPHELSGGMRQRVMIAMALLCDPELLIADEPTTALDVTIQAQILELMAELRLATKTATVLITHDLGVVAGLCDRVAVMYAGRIVETGAVRDIFYRPRHPYTQGLLRSMPRIDADAAELSAIPGQPPNQQRLPSGCAFRPRCAHRLPVCAITAPPLRPTGGTHVAC